MASDVMFYRSGNSNGWTKWNITGEYTEISYDLTANTDLVDRHSFMLFRRNNFVYFTIDFRSLFNADTAMFVIPERFRPSTTKVCQIKCSRVITINNTETIYGDPWCGGGCDLNTDGVIAQHFNSGETNKWVGTIRCAYLLN